MSNLSFSAIYCHGSDNRFMLIDEQDLCLTQLQDSERSLLSRMLCHEKTDYSVDGVLFCNQTDFANFYEVSAEFNSTMRMFNPDGSEAEMCGNGLRCAGRYDIEKKESTQSHVATPLDILRVRKVHEIFSSIPSYESEIGLVTWSIPTLNPPSGIHDEAFLNQSLPLLDELLDARIKYTALSIPNPHFIGISPMRFTQDKIVKAWEVLSACGMFPQGINLSIVSALEGHHNDRASIFVSTCERGVGPTNACGTAMAASSIVAAEYTNWIKNNTIIEVFNPGGMVWCDVFSQQSQNKVLITGNASWIEQLRITVDTAEEQIKIELLKEYTEERESYAKLKKFAQQIVG